MKTLKIKKTKKKWFAFSISLNYEKKIPGSLGSDADFVPWKRKQKLFPKTTNVCISQVLCCMKLETHFSQHSVSWEIVICKRCDSRCKFKILLQLVIF